MRLRIDNPLISVDWLNQHLNNDNIILLDATISKVTAKDTAFIDEKMCIKNAIFFDIKNVFSDVNSPFPNTVLSDKEFESKAQDLGIRNDSCIIVYDDLGIYSSARVWWLFQLMGFKNIAVLDGGFPAWKANGYSIEYPKDYQLKRGNFTVDYQPEKIKFTTDVFSALNNDDIVIADARSNGRFYGMVPEPRADVKGGHIPNSVSLPYSDVLENGKLKSKGDLISIFNKINPNKKDFIFSCGTGITASVLALAANIAGYSNHSVYDGSWTEWGSTTGLPIQN